MGGSILKENSFKKIIRSKPFRIILVVLLALLLLVSGFYVYARTSGENHLKNTVVAGETTGITVDGERYIYNENIVNFLILGIDKYTDIENTRQTGSQGLSDAVFLLSYNLKSEDLSLLMIPRDTMVPLLLKDNDGNVVPGDEYQLTIQYSVGESAEESCELSAQTVSDLLGGIPIHRYLAMNLNAVAPLNDAIGGVEVEVLEDINGMFGQYKQGETILLEGNQALDYVKTRDVTVAESALGRVARQRQYLTAYYTKAVEAMKSDYFLPVRLLFTLKDYIYTDLDPVDLIYLSSAISGSGDFLTDINTVPGTVTQPGELEEYHVDQDQLNQLLTELFFFKETDA